MSEKSKKNGKRKLTDNERTQVAIMTHLKTDVGDAILNFKEVEQKKPKVIYAEGAAYGHMEAYSQEVDGQKLFLGIKLLYKEGLGDKFEIV